MIVQVLMKHNEAIMIRASSKNNVKTQPSPIQDLDTQINLGRRFQYTTVKTLYERKQKYPILEQYAKCFVWTKNVPTIVYLRKKLMLEKEKITMKRGNDESKI